MRRLVTILCAMAAVPAVAQPASGEFVRQAALADFVLAFREEGEGNLIEERVPRGETVERWTRMVTVQRFAGTAQRLSPSNVLENIQTTLPGGCPGATTSSIRTFTVSGRNAAQMRADCPILAQTGRPETFLILAIAGGSDMHLAQVAFRRVPTSEDIAWADRQLASVALCTAASREAVCRR